MNKKTQKEPENNKDIQVEEVIEEQKTDKIQELEQEIAEWKDKYLRCMAEFENFRKRSIAEKADWIRLALRNLLWRSAMF
jgi:molecular chaperone GrpE